MKAKTNPSHLTLGILGHWQWLTASGTKKNWKIFESFEVQYYGVLESDSQLS